MTTIEEFNRTVYPKSRFQYLPRLKLPKHLRDLYDIIGKDRTIEKDHWYFMYWVSRCLNHESTFGEKGIWMRCEKCGTEFFRTVVGKANAGWLRCWSCSTYNFWNPGKEIESPFPPFQ